MPIFERYSRPHNLQLNPYKKGILNIIKRLRWDLTRESIRSRKSWQRLKNTHVDQKAVILCNGPSLLSSNLDLLKHIPTFGLNKINFLFSRSSFRPTYIVSCNPFVIKQNQVFYNQTKIMLFMDSVAHGLIQPRSNVTFFHSTNYRGFAGDVSLSLYQGFTVTYVAMQIAFHLGFRQIALIGCDHSFQTKGPANSIVTAENRDPNHFDPAYFANGNQWQLPDLNSSEIYYFQALKTFQEAGGCVWNATNGGHLEILPRISLENFLDRSKHC